MRKKSLILIIFLLLVLFSPKKIDNVYAISYFAKIETEDCYLYSSPFDNEENKLFLLPKTYFVKILGEENEEFYKATYIDQNGYIKKSEIRFIKETPISPYADNLSFRVFAQHGLALRSSPYTSTSTINIITTIPFLETNLIYYGTRIGEESIIYKGNIWFYCKYKSGEQTLTGYVYSAYCDLLPTIKDNQEEVTYIDPPSFDIKAEQTIAPQDKLSEFETPAQVAIIVLVSLPCVLIAYFLFKPTLVAQTNPKRKKKKKGKIKKLKKSDYFELDDEYFNS